MLGSYNNKRLTLLREAKRYENWSQTTSRAAYPFNKEAIESLVICRV